MSCGVTYNRRYCLRASGTLALLSSLINVLSPILFRGLDPRVIKVYCMYEKKVKCNPTTTTQCELHQICVIDTKNRNIFS